jgi:hypothetical protein
MAPAPSFGPDSNRFVTRLRVECAGGPRSGNGSRQVAMKSSLWFDASMLVLILVVAVVARAIGA